MSVVANRSRAELAEHALALREIGYLYREIADMLGISRSYAASLITDPTGVHEMERKKRYGGVCVDCGAGTDGSKGRYKAPLRCSDCRCALQHEDRYWNRETVVSWFREFARLFGRGPAVVDVAQARSIQYGLSATRRAEAEETRATMGRLGLKWPHPAVVSRECGSWDEALRLAGLPPNATGGAAHRSRTRRRP